MSSRAGSTSSLRHIIPITGRYKVTRQRGTASTKAGTLVQRWLNMAAVAGRPHQRKKATSKTTSQLTKETLKVTEQNFAAIEADERNAAADLPSGPAWNRPAALFNGWPADALLFWIPISRGRHIGSRNAGHRRRPKRT